MEGGTEGLYNIVHHVLRVVEYLKTVIIETVWKMRRRDVQDHSMSIYV